MEVLLASLACLVSSYLPAMAQFEEGFSIVGFSLPRAEGTALALVGWGMIAIAVLIRKKHRTLTKIDSTSIRKTDVSSAKSIRA